MRMKQLANGTQEQIDRASKAWRSGQKAIERYSDTVGGLQNPRLDVDSSAMQAKMQRAIQILRQYGLSKPQAALLINDLATGKIKNVQQLIDQYGMSKKAATALLNDLASGKIRGVQSLLNSLHDKTVTITTVYETSYRNKRSGIPMPGQSADGGFVPKTGLPYADRHPYLLADGEGVTTNRNGETDRFRDVVEGINAGLTRSQIKGMLADGGIVGDPTLGMGGPGTRHVNQLTGIGHNWLSAAELAERLLNLNNRQLVGLDRDIEHLGKKSLPKLGRALEMALGDLRKSLDKETQIRDRWVQRADDLRSSIKQGLQQDIFGQSGGWNASADPNSILRGNIAREKEFTRLIRTLKSKGVDGAALQAIIASGDIDRARLMASMSKSYLATYERLYAQSNRGAQVAGSTAAQALGITKHIAESNRELRQIRHELKLMKHAMKVQEKRADESRHRAAEHGANKTGDKVNGAASNGRRNQRRGGAYSAN
jgi:hypothetical protein